MKHRQRTSLIATVALTLCLAGVAPAQDAATSQPAITLKPGDAAPALAVGKWIKGEPVAKFEPGTVYVVECWATWCGPCIAAIPHVTAIQKKHEGKLVVIGMNVFEQDDAKVEPFVAQMGDKMAYRVAMDDKSKDAEGAMATTWLAAAGRDTIPTSYIVDQQGKIAWIGHPMEMEPILDQVLAGTFDVKANAARDDQKKAVLAKINTAARANDVDGALAAIDELAKLDPTMTKQLAFARFRFLLQAKRFDQAYGSGDQLLSTFAEEPAALAQLAAIITIAPGLEKRDLTLARKFAEKAADGSKRDPAILDLLARVAFDQGDRARAIAVEQEAIDKATDDKAKAEMRQTLAKYQNPTTAPTISPTTSAATPVIQ